MAKRVTTTEHYVWVVSTSKGSLVFGSPDGAKEAEIVLSHRNIPSETKRVRYFYDSALTEEILTVA